MNGIVINDKHYIFIKTDKSVDCDKCDLDKDDICGTSILCEHFSCLLHGTTSKVGIFKELKIE